MSDPVYSNRCTLTFDNDTVRLIFFDVRQRFDSFLGADIGMETERVAEVVMSRANGNSLRDMLRSRLVDLPGEMIQQGVSNGTAPNPADRGIQSVRETEGPWTAADPAVGDAD